MKKTLAIVMLAMLLAGSAVAQVKWSTIEEAAKTDNSRGRSSSDKKGKLYFIDFYTTWCGWCKRMDRDTFSNSTVAKLMNKYYTPIKFDAEGHSSFTWNGTSFSQTVTEGRATHPFARAILGQRMGFPSFAIFDDDKTLLTVVPGYMSPDDFLVVLWYFASGDYREYTYDDYMKVFAKEKKPVMEKAL